MPLLGPGGYPMPSFQGIPQSVIPSMLGQLPGNPVYNSVLGTSGPFNPALALGLPGGAATGAGAASAIPGVIPEAVAGGNLLSRIPGVGGTFAGGGWKGTLPWASDASLAAKGIGAAKLFGYPILGQQAGNLITKFAGGSQATESNPLAQFGRGAAKGAGLGATVGALGGPFAEITAPVGAAVGGVVGGLADALDVTGLFKAKDKSVEKYNKAADGFDALMAQVTGNDTASRSYINQQLGFQASIISADDTISSKDKAKALTALISQGQQLLGQYVSNPAAFRQQAVAATQAYNGGGAGIGPSPTDQLAMQAAIGSWTGPIADQIEATGKQQAALYGERGGQIGGERGAALTFQGQALAQGATNVANAYRAQAQLMPAKYIFDQYGVMRPATTSSPTYVQQQSSQSGGTSSTMDQLLAQLSTGGSGGLGG